MSGWPDEILLSRILKSELKAAGLEWIETGEDLRIRDRGGLRTIVNYAPKPLDASHLIGPSDTVLIGEAMLDVAGLAIVQRG